MSHLVPGFQRNASGRVVHRYFDGADWPADGWYDSPDKVPGALPGQPPVERYDPVTDPIVAPKPYGAFGTVYGEKTQAQKAHEQALSSPRKNGKFSKGRR